MVTCLLDTSILIDLIHKYPPAHTWITTQEKPGVASIVCLELIQGARDKSDQQKALNLLYDLERVDFTASDMDWAIASLLKYDLSHNVGAIDCLIASIPYRLDVPLYTRNLKHFIPLLGSLAQSPYP
jgi:predicted nucleic acid-binding protein